MKKQCVVIEETPNRFREECAKLMRDGWTVIPGTVSASTSQSAFDNGFHEVSHREDLMIAFFEKTI